jgi:hypothetical protein
LSLKIVTKFFKPTNFIGPNPFHETKLRTKENITGIKTKIKKPIKFGKINE